MKSASHLAVNKIGKNSYQDIRDRHEINYAVIDALSHGILTRAFQYSATHSTLCAAVLRYKDQNYNQGKA